MPLYECIVSVLFYTFTLRISQTFAENRIFKLPRLILHADRFYLVRRQEVDLSCQIEPGWRGVTMADVDWMKDGIPIDEIKNKHIADELVADGPTLRILNGRHHAEGDYQCSAVVRGVRISNGQHIDTRLVSAPVKFRRARITKFDKVNTENIIVTQGQIARLPCSGMPDVVPGPPEVWFEREGSDQPLGVDPISSNQRYLSTSSGMQMSLSKLSDSGSYYCVVRNTFTNQTRKSPFPVVLEVLPRRYNVIEPVLVYPVTLSSLSSPIVVDVVKGKNVLLECVVASAKIMWTKINSSLVGGFSISNEKARFRQVWGNLRIRMVNEADSGIYVCKSSPIFSRGSVEEYPRVFYNLQVHAPTDVQLMLGQLEADNSWQLSCLAINLHYEIPMVFINGLALIDAMDKLGVPPQTNFFTNPINATLTSSVALSGSVQCISRPAMDEAEVYGDGLERGRAMNLYVDNRVHKQINLISQGPENSTRKVGESIQLVCLVVPRATRTLWIKDGNRVLLIGKKRVRLVGTATLQINDIQPEDEGWYTCEAADNTGHETRSRAYLRVIGNVESKLTSTDANVQDADMDHSLGPRKSVFKGTNDNSHATEELPLLDTPKGFVAGRSIRVQWSVAEKHPDANSIMFFKVELRRSTDDGGRWILSEQLDNHVRATTIRALVPGSSYQFRIGAHLQDHSTFISEPTEWLLVDKTSGSVALPLEPTIGAMSAESDRSLRLNWSYDSVDPLSMPKKFIIEYCKSSSDNCAIVESNADAREIILSNLEPATEYKALVIAENGLGRSERSQLAYARTNAELVVNSMETNRTSLFSMTTQRFTIFSLHLATDAVTFVLMTSLLASFFLLLVGCLLWCAFRQRLSKKRTKSAKGKFVDTSHRIFNEQRVQKTRLYHASAALCMVQDDPNEFSPLKTNGSENRVSPASSLKDFPFSRSGRTVPNLYGAGDDFSENEGNMGDGTITDGCIGPKYGGSASQFHDRFWWSAP